MEINLSRLSIGILCMVFISGCFGGNPEDTVRDVFAAGQDGDFKKMAGVLSGRPLRTLLQYGARPASFSRFFRSIANVMSGDKREIKIFFTRAAYFNKRRSARISFLFRIGNNGRYIYQKKSWLLKNMNGGWKIVSF